MGLFSQIKTVLGLAGIKNISVEFEPDAAQIRVGYDHAGERIEEIIPFEQIETMFSDSQGAAQEPQRQEIPSKV